MSARRGRTVAGTARGAVRRLANLAYVGQAGRAGFALRDVHAVRSYDLLREIEARYHLATRTVLYIGANRGQELPLLLLAYPEATIHCFEPQPACQADLARAAAAAPGRVRVHQVALSDRVGTAVMRRPASQDQAASLLTPAAEMGERFPHVGGWEEVEVATTTLDQWATEHGLGEDSEDVLVKLDVQGAEGLVLDGGPTTMSRVRTVICELAVVPTYADAPDLRPMFDRFLSLGFGYAGELAQVRDTEAVVVEFDGAFVRPRSVGGS